MFTLIEGLLALAITGKLLVVALPTLHDQTPRSRVEMRAQYLVALSEVLERGYQQTQRYPSQVLMDFPDLSTDRPPRLWALRRGQPFAFPCNPSRRPIP